MIDAYYRPDVRFLYKTCEYTLCSLGFQQVTEGKGYAAYAILKKWNICMAFLLLFSIGSLWYGFPKKDMQCASNVHVRERERNDGRRYMESTYNLVQSISHKSL